MSEGEYGVTAVGASGGWSLDLVHTFDEPERWFLDVDVTIALDGPDDVGRVLAWFDRTIGDPALGTSTSKTAGTGMRPRALARPGGWRAIESRS